MKIEKKNGGGGGQVGGGGGRGRVGGFRVDVNGEVKFCENSKKKKFFFLGGGGRAGGVRSGDGVGEGE